MHQEYVSLLETGYVVEDWSNFLGATRDTDTKKHTYLRKTNGFFASIRI